jgi:predicted glutamine amidotransferase
MVDSTAASRKSLSLEETFDMCGIVGFVHGGRVRQDTNRSDWFTSALYAGALRGMHSTGVFAVEDSHEVYLMKAAQEAATFIDRRTNADVLDSLGWGTRAAVGHNRFATSGKINFENAHPYQHGEITLVHNGTLKAYYHMPSHEEADTDSSRIAAALNAASPASAVKVLEELQGAYALVWYDARSATMNFARNDERPLDYLYLNNDQLFFTSEGGMCSWLTERHGLTDKYYATHPFSTHVLYTVHTDDDGAFVLNGGDKLAWEKQEYTPARPPLALVPERGAGAVVSTSGGSGKSLKKLNKRLKEALLKCGHGDLMEVQGSYAEPYKGPDGKDRALGMVQGWFDITDQNFLTDDGFKGHLFADVHQCPVLPESSPIEMDTMRARITGMRKEEHGDVTLLGSFVKMLQHRFDTCLWDNCKEVHHALDGQRWMYDDEDRPIHRHDHFKLSFTSREVDVMTDEGRCKECNKEAYYVPAMETFFPDSCTEVGEFVCGDCYQKGWFGDDGNLGADLEVVSRGTA